MMTNDDTIETLNYLLTKAYDAEQGYAQAAKRVDEAPRLRAFCNAQSEMRLSFGKDLKAMIAQYGGEPNKGSSVAGKAHQIWITIKDAVTGDDEEAILEECIRGEESAIEEYDGALGNTELPADVAALIRSQRQGIAGALQKVRIKEAIADAADD